MSKEIIDQVTQELRPRNPRGDNYRYLYNRRDRIRNLSFASTDFTKEITRLYLKGLMSFDTFLILVKKKWKSKEQFVFAMKNNLDSIPLGTKRQLKQAIEVCSLMERQINERKTKDILCGTGIKTQH